MFSASLCAGITTEIWGFLDITGSSIPCKFASGNLYWISPCPSFLGIFGSSSGFSVRPVFSCVLWRSGLPRSGKARVSSRSFFGTSASLVAPFSSSTRGTSRTRSLLSGKDSDSLSTAATSCSLSEKKKPFHATNHKAISASPHSRVISPAYAGRRFLQLPLYRCHRRRDGAYRRQFEDVCPANASPRLSDQLPPAAWCVPVSPLFCPSALFAAVFGTVRGHCLAYTVRCSGVRPSPAGCARHLHSSRACVRLSPVPDMSHAL